MRIRLLPISIIVLAAAVLAGAILIYSSIRASGRPAAGMGIARIVTDPANVDELALNDPDFFQLIGARAYDRSADVARFAAIETWLAHKHPEAFNELTVGDRDQVVSHLTSQSHNLLAERDFENP